MKGKLPIILLTIPIFVIGGILAMILTKGDAVKKLESFPAASYLENPGSYVGNRYLLDGQIDELLSFVEGKGKIVTVMAGKNSTRVPIYVPASEELNLHKGQRYEMAVYINTNSVIYVEKLQKY